MQTHSASADEGMAQNKRENDARLGKAGSWFSRFLSLGLRALRTEWGVAASQAGDARERGCMQLLSYGRAGSLGVPVGVVRVLRRLGGV